MKANLSTGELAALASYATEHGRNWKEALRTDWMNAKVDGPRGAILHGLRNSTDFGPSGLVDFRFPKRKVTFTAVDPMGIVHRRTSDRRTYTHTVVGKRSYAAALAAVTAKHWRASDVQNFHYQTAIAEGRDPYPSKNWCSERHTTEQIVATQVRVDAENAARLIKARAEIAPHADAEAYAVAMQIERIADVDKANAEGGYDRYDNLGWCGRLDLAQKLAAGHPRAVILDAVVEP
jgi:hypothetical protein